MQNILKLANPTPPMSFNSQVLPAWIHPLPSLVFWRLEQLCFGGFGGAWVLNRISISLTLEKNWRIIAGVDPSLAPHQGARYNLSAIRTTAASIDALFFCSHFSFHITCNWNWSLTIRPEMLSSKLGA